ncbi:MAG: magnesium/cobalt transporter CorA [Rubripirellula sp.]|nr:magnesium/cobalt transporter CorA [Rubripirellula sp.]
MFHKRHPEVGARPGTLVLGPATSPVTVQVTRVSQEHVSTHTCDTTAELPGPDERDSLLWIDIQGLHDGEILQQIAKKFEISPLAMEDLVNVPQRPKSELFRHQHLVVAHCLIVNEHDKAAVGQLGIVFGENYVLTFHQNCEHVLSPIRNRLDNPSARLRRKGPDYLVYAILDACVDGCFPFLEGLGDTIETMEQAALQSPRPELLAQIHTAKNLLARLRRSIWPQKEVVVSLLTGDSPFIAEDTRSYIRDTADHCAQLADVVDMYRESTSGLVNTYMTSVAHRSNEIMKVLTLLTSVFVPPTFLAGVYGMNFNEMPELSFPYAYQITVGVMASMIAGTIFYFRRRGWLTGTRITAKPGARPANVNPSGKSRSKETRHVAQNIVLNGDFEAVSRQAA